MDQLLVERLSQALTQRHLDDLKGVLVSVRADLAASARLDLSPEVLDYVARCMDLDWGLFPLFEKQFSRLPIPPNPTLADRAHFDIIEGLLHFHRSHFELAFRSFENATFLARRTSNNDLMSVSLYYLARAAWRRGQYAPALVHADEAKKFAESANLPGRVVLIEMLKGWLHFLLGEFASADFCVDTAERGLNKEKDHVTMGDVWSYRGRRARQSGALSDAIKCFKKAITEYSRFEKHYRNVARCHANIGYVNYLQHREVHERAPGDKRTQKNEEERTLIRHALFHSKEAEKIYNLHPLRTRRGRAKVLNERALVQVASGEWQQAIGLAQAAFDLAEGVPVASAGKRSAVDPAGRSDADRVAMSNARVILCIVAYERDQHVTALRMAREAWELARTTQNRRAQARALIWHGFSTLKFDNVVEADTLYVQAADRLKPELDNSTTDYLVKDLARLRRAIDDYVACEDPVVVKLTAQRVRGRELEETLNHVEDLVIRHVYEANNRNAEKAAGELRIGDERVRRSVGPVRRKPGRQ